MSINYRYAILILTLGIIVNAASADGMQNTSFKVTNSVLAGGSAFAGSADYQINGTLGQSTTLMEPLDPPFSDNYDLYPGFWYVIAVFESTCPGDFNGDKDVDGSHLAEYIFDSGGLDLEVFAANFGKVNCP